MIAMALNTFTEISFNLPCTLIARLWNHLRDATLIDEVLNDI
jgi:hypothetical protein